MPVAILSDEDFDAINVDSDTVVFLGASPVKSSIEDVDCDMDMSLKFKTQELNFDLLVEEGDDYPYAYLMGDTIDEQLFVGKDTVRLLHQDQRQINTILSQMIQRFSNLFPILQRLILRLGLQN